MIIRILAIGNKMPSWVNDGFKDYAKRFTAGCSLELCEIPAEKRNAQRLVHKGAAKKHEKKLTRRGVNRKGNRRSLVSDR